MQIAFRITAEKGSLPKLEMRSFRALRILTSALSLNSQKTHFVSPLLQRFYSAETQREFPTSGTEEEDENTSAVFDSPEYSLGVDFSNDSKDSGKLSNPLWDEKYRERLESEIFRGKVVSSRSLRNEEKKKNAALLAMSLLGDAVRLQDKHEEDKEEKEMKMEDQKSLNVGIIGAPNAGKSALTNNMVGTKL